MTRINQTMNQCSLTTSTQTALRFSHRAKSVLAALALAPLLAACGAEMAAGDEPAEGMVEEEATAEEAFPGVTGTPQTLMVETESGPQSLTYELINNNMVLDGDIILDPAEEGATTYSTRIRRLTDSKKLWPDCKIPYEISSTISNDAKRLKNVTDAIAHWESKTAVRFVKRTDSNERQYKDYLVFKNGDGCSSHIGRKSNGGSQDVILGRSCSRGNAIHEIGHAVGLFHEQSRMDRGKWVKVNKENIKSGKEHNFDTKESMAVGDFDFGSVMLYSSNDFSKNGKPTLVRNDGSTWKAQREKLSEGDLNGIADLCGRP